MEKTFQSEDKRGLAEDVAYSEKFESPDTLWRHLVHVGTFFEIRFVAIFTPF